MTKLTKFVAAVKKVVNQNRWEKRVHQILDLVKKIIDSKEANRTSLDKLHKLATPHIFTRMLYPESQYFMSIQRKVHTFFDEVNVLETRSHDLTEDQFFNIVLHKLETLYTKLRTKVVR